MFCHRTRFRHAMLLLLLVVTSSPVKKIGVASTRADVLTQITVLSEDTAQHQGALTFAINYLISDMEQKMCKNSLVAIGRNNSELVKECVRAIGNGDTEMMNAITGAIAYESSELLMT